MIRYFIILFRELKSRTNNSAANLDWSGNEVSDVKELASRTYQVAKWVKLELLKKRDEIVIETVDDFEELWAEFNGQYRPRIADHLEKDWQLKSDFFVRRLRKLLIAEGLSTDEVSHQIYEVTGIEWNESMLGSYEPPQPDPTSDDLVQLFEDGLIALAFELEEIFDRGSDEYNADVWLGLRAWEEFSKLVGLRLQDVDRRWKKLPIVFWSETRNPLAGSTGLGDRLREAVRAFVFGNTHACIALCRSIIELVLKEYYGASGKDLREMIDGDVPTIVEI